MRSHLVALFLLTVWHSFKCLKCLYVYLIICCLRAVGALLSALWAAAFRRGAAFSVPWGGMHPVRMARRATQGA